jgi:hypothetical protein
MANVTIMDKAGLLPVRPGKLAAICIDVRYPKLGQARGVKTTSEADFRSYADVRIIECKCIYRQALAPLSQRRNCPYF